MGRLVECPHCFGEIDSRATKCKHCGEWVKRRSSVRPSSRSFDRRSRDDDDQGLIREFMGSRNLSRTVNAGVKIYAVWWVVSGVIGLIVFAFIFFGFFLPTWNKGQERMDRSMDRMDRMEKEFERMPGPRWSR